MEKKGVKPDVITFNKILDCLYGNQRFSDAEMIWGVMVEKNVVPDIRSYNANFNALIKGFVGEGNLEEAKQWYGELVKSGCAPDKWTFETLVPFACEKGDVEYGFELCKDIFQRRRLC
ncbi:hypothetical protein ACLB2K_024772 [Fragaria x ananassa]